MPSHDAVIVGSGINSLVAGALLSRRGWDVVVLEREDRLGGALRTAEITEPGFVHEVFAGYHPLFVMSEAYAELAPELGQRGLEYMHAPIQTGSLVPGSDPVLFGMSREDNVAEFERHGSGDGQAWAGVGEWFERSGGVAMAVLGSELWSRRALGIPWFAYRSLGARGAVQLGGELLRSYRDWAEVELSSETVRGFFAPLPLHAGRGPDDASSALMAQLVALSIEMVGLPTPRGGGGKLVEALVGIIEDNGGSCETGCDVERIETSGGKASAAVVAGGERYAAKRAVLANVTPQQLYLDLLRAESLPEEAVAEARRFRYGRAGMQIHMALSEPPAWRHEKLAEVAAINVTPGLDAVSRAVNEATRHLIPAELTLAVGQHVAIDSSRAPDGGWTLWIQLLELPSRPRGDAAGELDVGDGTWTEQLREAVADRVQRQLAAEMPNLDAALLKRVAFSPVDLEAANRNHVGGDIYAGSHAIDQSLLWRPRAGLPGHRTPVDNLYQIGASTHPGAGLGAGSGTLVAKELLGGRFGPGRIRSKLSRGKG